MSEKRFGTLNVQVVIIPVFQLAGFFDKSYWCVTLTEKGKRHAETAGYDRNRQSGFNELSVTEPATVGEIAQNTYFHANAAS